jgi:hypothetical protein
LVPKLINDQAKLEVKLGEQTINNITGVSFNIGVDSAGDLSLQIVGPEVDFTVGDYQVKTIRLDWRQTVEILKDGEFVPGVQFLTFDGKTLFMEVRHMWREAYWNQDEPEYYEIEVRLDD